MTLLLVRRGDCKFAQVKALGARFGEQETHDAIGDRDPHQPAIDGGQQRVAIVRGMVGGKVHVRSDEHRAGRNLDIVNGRQVGRMGEANHWLAASMKGRWHEGCGGRNDGIMSTELTTDRLTMRPHSVADFAELAAMWADPDVVRLLGSVPSTEEESWARLLRYAGNWALLGFGFWCVRRRDTGAYMGDIGFLEARRTGVDGFDGDPEIGWSLTTAARGQGFASEAVMAALGWGSTRFARTVAMINPLNTASEAVARRCGFAPFATSSYKDAPTRLWEVRW
jgi:RimJ/RimL family protein N-acetyltransferase